MAPVQSRLVLAVSIPAAALAIFLSLFWLRRSSKGHPPSPPDIPDKQDSKVSDCPEKTASGNLDRSARDESAEKFNSESADKITVVDDAVAQSSVFLKTDLSKFPGDVRSEVKVCQVITVNALDEVAIPSSDVNEIQITTTPLCESKNNISLLPVRKDTTVVEHEPHLKDKVINNLESDSNTKQDISALPPIEEIVVAVRLKETESTPINPIPQSQESDTEKDNSNHQQPIDEMITEEASSPIKLEYEKQTDMEKSDLVEKLANLELDTMKMGDVDIKERDSANHSPSENMLASPSMSNFSDAHSEGSSDSGKGHSDGTTSPSRTPAGGSSVSGDPSPSIYEFIIPQVIVGRLIGRHGVFLNEIMSVTHTSIFIKVHPESVKLKVCAIEGSQQDIDKALDMIRKKFPLKRFPKLTLERVYFVQLQNQQQLRSEDFHLQLIDGVNNDVILSSLLSPGQFFVQQPCHPSYPCLTPLTHTLTQAYSSTDAPALVSPVSDAICVCPSLGGWYRAQIVSVDEDSRHCDIKFVDYGGYLRVDSALLKQIRADFLMLPFQAVECCLANIQPIFEAGWSEEARVFVHNMTFGRVLQAQVISYTDNGIPLVNLYTSINAQVVLVNAELVSNGYAVYSSPPVQEEEGEAAPLPLEATV